MRGDLLENAVEIVDLVKHYRAQGTSPGKLALDCVSLFVPQGSFFGLLGPNGAGKSTLINILAGLVRPTSGSARVWGYDVKKEDRRARASIGVVPQEITFDAFFSPREVLDIQAGLYGVPKSLRRTNELLEAMGLADKANSHARSLSGGMRRRLLIAKALVHTPPVLVLDEPTAGVDIELRQHLWRYVRELNQSGVTILLTTHYLEEAEQLCDRIAIIDKGKVVANEETETLLARLDGKSLSISTEDDINAALPESRDFQIVKTGERRIEIRYRPSRINAGAILEVLRAANIGIADIATTETDLEDIFLSLTHHEPPDDTCATP
ncbi:multidrug ABC transporter ATP-binding protein [Alphaproteobacteria bacterium]|nr:multidrug ABC transporter ATP-binding protein [Alphaproteobacteria bacterium]